jgi:type I restriction enzyme S subunit
VLIEDKTSYKRIRPNDLAYNMMRAWQGAFGVAKVDGMVSPAYVVARPLVELHAPFVEYLVRSPLYVEQMRASSRGIADFRQRLYWEHFRQIPIALPELRRQQEITEFLDLETGRISQLIEKKNRLADLMTQRWSAIIHEARSSSTTRVMRFGHLARRSQRPIPRGQEPDRSYVALGLFNRGRGIFKKNPAVSDELGDSDFFWIEEGDLILSGQFAWEGAVALAGTEHVGSVVSHRYPVYRGRDGISTAYLFAYLRTDPGQFILSDNSRGAAGRNRPLNTNRLEKEKIPIPAPEVQKAVAAIVAQQQRLSSMVSTSIDRLEEFRSALITAAVTGQIDVAAWRKKGATERFIDQRVEQSSRREARA